ncbi:hypothetical protein SAMN05421788_106254 [Filimonas lacunae]|uniref:Uncharacterized protein n=1 Tax=Filimonas lacunae TaxID=477680 RepID=A0A1N7QQY2_9BACT|nr:hypothetical protein SAMN05421788_106254 [Filimonas lacunae]
MLSFARIMDEEITRSDFKIVELLIMKILIAPHQKTTIVFKSKCWLLLLPAYLAVQILFPSFFLLACNSKVKQPASPESVLLKKGERITDTVLLKQKMYPFTPDGLAPTYSNSIGRFRSFYIVNNTKQVIYLYSRRDVQYPLDTLRYVPMEPDSILVAGRFIAMERNPWEVHCYFTTFCDSLLPTASKLRWLECGSACNSEAVKGYFVYGVKDSTGKVVSTSVPYEL